MNQLGINFTNLAAQIVNFLILFWVLNKFVFQNVVKIIENHKRELKETQEKVKKIDSEVVGLEKRKQEELTKTRQEQENILNSARAEANEQKKEIINKAHKEAKEMALEAEVEIKNKEEEMKEKVKNEAAQLAVHISAELIAKTLSLKDQQVLIKKAIAQFQKTNL